MSAGRARIGVHEMAAQAASVLIDAARIAASVARRAYCREMI
jgi:hypothetical protein